MKFSGVRKILMVTGGVFLFAFMLGKAQPLDFNEHNRYVDNINHLKEIDGEIDREILKAKSGITKDYKPIINDFATRKDYELQLQLIPRFIDRQCQRKINNSLQAYMELLQQKEQLFEEFKDKNSILQNSLSYLPIAVSEFSTKAAENYSDSQLATELNNLLKDVILYNFYSTQESSSEDLTAKINTLIEKITQLKGESTEYTDLDTAIANAKLIVENQPQVNSLVAQIRVIPTNQSSEKLSELYDVCSQEAIDTTNIYRIVVYVVSAVLTASISIYTIQKLRKSAAIVEEAEEKYKSIFETSVEGICQTTTDGGYIRVNSTLAQIYGYSSAEELCGKINDIGRQLYVQPHRRDEFVQGIQKQGSVSGFESQVYRKDGSTIWISEKARAVCDRQGNLLYYEGTVEDITVRKAWQEALRNEQEQSDRLLLNILPQLIAERLKQKQSTIADSFDEVTVLFADLVGFTELASRLSPTQLVELLNQIFSAFDELSQGYGLEKIKTIGDAYMVVGGLPKPRRDHAEAIAQMALDMQKIISHFNTQNNQALSIRIGINTGPVVAGVIGIKKFSYDLWGDTVNTASRMESQGKANRIQVTEETYQRLKDKFVLEDRGEIPVKGKGKMQTYFLIGKIDGDK
ncbi:adenylate/guanylate cyclase domain-containing protein [Limnofasciculus baicalensis]|uniref:Adenylate cyclase n=1 Tax=Limnofasciculus baicalensis BBK-W-15 TaxID=2699891 RepID=A0AAE3KLP4_9CYAN|nr:adenylate/guanylate cyclase domain-containing protein [Limnofasciculus baicalensis]MCP2728745.1 PAS domain S-box protein [Limnofasciculus baicalensis BBK-W-15]